MTQKPVEVRSELVVPHRIVKVGVATSSDSGVPVPPDTVADPVGRRAIARAAEAVRDVPKRERIIKVGMAGENNKGIPQGTNKVPSVVPAKIGDIYPGEHRHAYQLEVGDRIMNLGQPTPEIGQWIRVTQVQLTKVDDSYTDAEIHGVGEAGHPLILHMAAHSQVRIVTNQENPYG